MTRPMRLQRVELNEAGPPADPLLALKLCQCAIDHLASQTEFIGNLRP